MSAAFEPGNNKWPVIIHQSLERSDYAAILRQKHFKIRISQSITLNTAIFPMSGVAFLILPLQDADFDKTTGEIEEELVKSLEKFIQVHRHCYILAQAARHGNKENKIFSAIQFRFLKSQLQMIPIHSASEGIQAMTNIAKLLCKPTCQLMSQRFGNMLSSVLMEDTTAAVLEHLGLNEHQTQVIQDSVGSLSRLATASREDLLDCSLDTETVNKVFYFFNRETKHNQ